uniref:inositol-polyphosphate 5-phosphatase n=1 Tax=Ixodes ricinus TaxID=34613 RepID=A0A131XVT3_IXORI
MGDHIPVLLVTANVGSIFEEPQTLLPGWIGAFLATVKKNQPSFLALHCQEVGGKNYEKTMPHVADFIRALVSSEELTNYMAVRVFLDEDFSCIEKFTALGNLYFVHQSLKNPQIWDFQECRFLPVTGVEVHSGNIEKVLSKEKVKFPQEFFPECKWSRKGFMRTRWSLHGTVFDLINIHLFHDESNFIAMESFPSLYTRNRQGALDYTLNRIQNDKYDKVPFFIFGDFNFRLDTQAVVEKITRKAPPVQVKSGKNGDVTKVLFRDPKDENRVVLTVERKVFSLQDHEEAFSRNNGKWLQEHDREPSLFKDRLFEFDIAFPPSYPFKEDCSGARSYMHTRCPAWCDRILLSKAARALVYTGTDESGKPPVTYQVMGADVCMGDHKPVALCFRMAPSAAGTFPAKDKASAGGTQSPRLLGGCPACHVL